LKEKRDETVEELCCVKSARMREKRGCQFCLERLKQNYVLENILKYSELKIMF